MPELDTLRRQLADLLAWGGAHATFEEAVKHIPPDLRGRAPEGLKHSPWQLLEHMRIAQQDILDFCRDPGYTEPMWPDDYWPASATPPDDAAWNASVTQFLADRKAMQDLITGPDADLFAPIPWGEGQTLLREAVLLADHNAYHIGQLIDARRLLGIWPPG